MLAERITSPSTDRAELTPFRTDSSELLVVAKKINPFGIKQIHRLASQHAAVCISNKFLTRTEWALPHPSSIFIPRVFMVLQIPFPATPFLSHLYKTGGVRGRQLQPKWKSVRKVSSAENEKSTGRY